MKVTFANSHFSESDTINIIGNTADYVTGNPGTGVIVDGIPVDRDDFYCHKIHLVQLTKTVEIFVEGSRLIFDPTTDYIQVEGSRASIAQNWAALFKKMEPASVEETSLLHPEFFWWETTSSWTFRHVLGAAYAVYNTRLIKEMEETPFWMKHSLAVFHQKMPDGKAYQEVRKIFKPHEGFEINFALVKAKNICSWWGKQAMPEPYRAPEAPRRDVISPSPPEEAEL